MSESEKPTLFRFPDTDAGGDANSEENEDIDKNWKRRRAQLLLAKYKAYGDVAARDHVRADREED